MTGQAAPIDLQIRPARAMDRPRLMEIFLTSRRVARHWSDPPDYSLVEFDKATAGESIWVAELGGTPVGFSSSWLPERFIHHFYVDPAHARHGIGGALLARTVQAIGTPARLKCVTKNETALRFYTHRGWQIIGQGRGIDGEHYDLEFRGPAMP